jgi:hypothetical protein
MAFEPKIHQPQVATLQKTPQPFFAANAMPIQAKLTVNEPGDAYEQEADAVADKVMRMPDPSVANPQIPFNKVSISSLQRKCSNCEKEEKVQRKEDGEEEQPVQLKSISDFAIQRACAACEKDDEKIQRKESGNTGGGRTAPSIVSDVISSSGQSLDKGTQQFMESRMGHDFSDVRVHTDSKAAESAQSINALAYTSGNHIAFNSGQYQPNTEGGRRLLAHELVHVGQQKPIESLFRIPAASPATTFAATLNYTKIAKEVHDGMAGWGTDEEGVYIALQKLNRDATAIKQLTEEYKKTYKAELVDDIYDDFSGSELEYALHLLDLGSPGTDQAINALPQTEADYITAAKRLWKAVDGPGTDEEAIYAVLLVFNRQKDLIDKLMLGYQKISKGENLRKRLKDELSGSEADYALWLLGDQPIFKDDQDAIAKSKLILNYIQEEARKRAKSPSSIDVASNLYKVLADDYLKDYFANPTVAEGCFR